MVASISYIAAGRSGAMADYYLKPTQPEWERNQDLEYQMRHAPDYPGTVPIFQASMPRQVIEAFRLDMPAMRADPMPQLHNLFAGLRADGGPTGKREISAYTRSDGKDFTPKKYFDVTVSNHISVGLAAANAETPAGRALLLSAAFEANSHAVTRLAERIGWARQGRAGESGEVRAHPLIVTFCHHATRPTQSGLVAPNIHFHNIVFSTIVTDSGRAFSLNAMKFSNQAIIKTKLDYHDRFENNLKAIGVETRRREIGDVVLSAVPDRINDHFAQRKQEILEKAVEIAKKQGRDFNDLSERERGRYIKYASAQTRGPSEDGITQTAQWRMECMRMNWTARDLPRLAVRTFNAFIESSLTDQYRQTWQQTRQAIEQSRIRHQPYAFNTRIRRKIVAATLALKLNQFEPQKRNLVDEFNSLAKSYSDHKHTITQNMLGRRQVRSLIPDIVELQQTMSDLTQRPSTTGPLQKDHESLGAYMAQKHHLPADLGPRLAAAGELVAEGRMTHSDALGALVQGRPQLETRLDRAITDTAGFYDRSNARPDFTVVGSYKPNGPVVFTSSYADAALARDATGDKVTVIAGRDDANTASIMRKWRETEPNREFVRLVDAGAKPETQGMNRTAHVEPPSNAAGASTWQDYAKSFGAGAVASNMRQSYKQEFKQSTGMKQSMAAE